jgi:hypothetical protein
LLGDEQGGLISLCSVRDVPSWLSAWVRLWFGGGGGVGACISIDVSISICVAIVCVRLLGSILDSVYDVWLWVRSVWYSVCSVVQFRVVIISIVILGAGSAAVVIWLWCRWLYVWFRRGRWLFGSIDWHYAYRCPCSYHYCYSCPCFHSCGCCCCRSCGSGSDSGSYDGFFAVWFIIIFGRRIVVCRSAPSVCASFSA